MAQDDHAIVVGITSYPGLGPLQGSCNDAQAFLEKWLLDPDGGSVPETNIHKSLTTMFHPPGPNGVDDVHPIELDIDDLFTPFIESGLQEGRVGRRLYIYMAGHGFSESNDMNSTALYAANAKPLRGYHIAGTAYAEWLRRHAVFDEIVLIMDCCRTTTPMQNIRLPELPNTPGQPSKANKVKIFYAYATSWGQTAREQEMNGQMRGIFTIALLDALAGAHSNRYGRVTGKAVREYIHNVINRIAGNADISPPVIQLNERRDIVWLERSTQGKTVRVHLQPFHGDEVVQILKGPDQMIEKVNFINQVEEIVLEPGFYKVLVENTAREKLFEVVEDDIEITV